jgi:transcriptional regulator with XRE-family HTH domain
MSLAAFAELIGCAASSLSMIETGDRSPGLQVALGIKAVAGIEPEEWATKRRKRREAA